MAKKSVATLQKGSGKEITKIIISERSEKTGAYVYKEVFVHNDNVKEVVAAAQK
ncbi:MAG TPA: DUF4295 domain-containing protein [Sphingobacterium sp.]|nr:DUF4295 domain-containing protein [Sphingobacterium sp.]